MARREGTTAERRLDAVSLPAALLRWPAADLPAPGDEAASRTCHEGTAAARAVAVLRDVTCYISTGRLPSGHRLGSAGEASRDRKGCREALASEATVAGSDGVFPDRSAPGCVGVALNPLTERLRP